MIVHALKMWRHYFLGRRFLLMIDHNGLKYLFDLPRLNAKHVMWMALISEFDFEIHHIKGKENQVTYALNRSMQTIHLAVANVCESDIRNIIKNSLQGDEPFNFIKESLEKEPRGKKCEGYHLKKERFLIYKNMLYIPNYIELKDLIMDEFHKRPYVGHPGYQKMITLVNKFYC
jgi:hypothetical protein